MVISIAILFFTFLLVPTEIDAGCPSLLHSNFMGEWFVSKGVVQQ